MTTARVNFLIAASAHRIGRTGTAFPARDGLRAHLRELAKTDTAALAQITLIRALPLVRNKDFHEDSDYYWDVDLGQFKCHAEVLDVEDRWFSYSSWVKAIMKWRTAFDYYVLIEDDFYPSHPLFASLLIAEHRRKLPQGGFLCGFATNHASSANGIVDSATFVRCLDRLADPMKIENQLEQGSFARAYCDDRVADYTDRYRCLSPSNTVVELSHDPCRTLTEDLIRPLEYLMVGEHVFDKSVHPTERTA